MLLFNNELLIITLCGYFVVDRRKLPLEIQPPRRIKTKKKKNTTNEIEMCKEEILAIEGPL